MKIKLTASELQVIVTCMRTTAEVMADNCQQTPEFYQRMLDLYAKIEEECSK